MLNYYSQCLDEIALEGLDGITLSTFFWRLSQRPGFTFTLDGQGKQFLWDRVKRSKIISAYCLPSPRPVFVPYRKNDHVDKETGILMEPANLPEEIYPTEVIDDTVNGIRGSCKTYKERIDVSEQVVDLSLQDVEAMYGDRLVLVGSQDARNRAILGSEVASLVDVSSLQYTMLERLGRARYEGEISIGSQSLHNVLNITDKTCFYYRTLLLKCDLITKQRFVQKLGRMANSTHGQIFHLKRFFTKHVVRIPNMVQAAIDKVSESPNKMVSAEELRKFLQPWGSVKKMLRTTEFQRYIKSKYVPVEDDDNETVQMYFIEDDSDDEEASAELKSERLDVSQRLVNQVLLRQTYNYIMGCGSVGCSQVQVSAALGMGRLDARTVCRALLRMGLTVSVMRQQGEKSKCWTYVAKVFEKQSTVVCGFKSQVQFYEEQKNSQKKKMKEENVEHELSYVERDITVKLTESEPQEVLAEQLYQNEMFLKRANFIITHLQKHGVIPLSDIRKLLFEESEKISVDLKLVARLIAFLVKDGLAKRVKAEMTAEKGSRTVEFVADSSVPLNSPLLRSVVDRHKDSFSISLAIQAAKKERKRAEKKPTKCAEDSKQYKQGSRFHRTQILHQMMFYLERGYTGAAVVGEERKRFLEDYDVEDLPDIYRKEMNWMTFISPIKDSVYKGWISLVDVLMRMPAQFAYDLGAFPESDKNVAQLLANPVKRYLTTLQLGSESQSDLFSQRFHSKLMETLRYLCALGLIQLGPEPTKKKQCQVYVNQYASLWDTRSSASGYCVIEEDKKYDVIEYNFNTIEDLERYWNDLYKIGLTSNLGSRYQLTKDSYTPFRKDKEQLVECFQSRERKEALNFDTGNLPGDHKGAAGTDSSLFVFKKINWMRPLRKPSIPRKKINKPEKKEIIKVKTLKKSRKKVDTKSKKRKLQQKPLRVVAPRVRKPSYDEIDRIALRKMKKQRSIFTASEDCFLIMCRAAAMFLFPGSEFPLISHVGVRDILNRKFPSLEMKTTKACQRRINFMFKDETTRADAQVLVEEMRHEPEMLKKFGQNCEATSKKENLKILDTCLEPLVERMLKRYKDASFKSGRWNEPKTLSQLKELYRFKTEGSAISKSVIKDVATQSDISLYKAMNAVVSALANASSDKRSLLYIYQQFSDDTLREAVSKMRSMEVIASLKKKDQNKMAVFSPLTVSQFKLSCRFMFKFITSYQYEMYEQCWELFKEIIADYELSEGVEATAYNLGGFTAAVASLMSQGKLVFSMDIPEHMLMLKSDEVNNASRVRGSKLWQTCQRLYLSDSPLSTEHLKAFNMSRKLIMLFRQQVQLNDPLDGHFLHHCLTVQSCKVICRLYVQETQEKEKESINIEHGHTKNTVYVDAKLLPQRKSCIDRTIANAANNMPDETPTFQQVRNKCLQIGFEQQELMALSDIYSCIYDGGSSGVTKQALMQTFQNVSGRVPLRHHLKQLLKAHLIWTVGTECIRYVAYEFVNQWTVLIATTVNQDSADNPEIQKEAEQTSSKRKAEDSLQEPPVKKMKKSTRVILKPWITSDGKLSKKVLDRMLGSLLSYMLTIPGCQLEKLSQKFHPALCPVQIYELIQLLIELECVTVIFASRKKKPSLFSRIEDTILREDPGGSLVEEFYETTSDAILKMAQFIGDKQYETDFMSQYGI